MQWRRAQVFSVGVELVRELHGFLKHLLLLAFTKLAEGLFVVVNQQHVFHESTPIAIH
jgi:hypothetical protein